MLDISLLRKDLAQVTARLETRESPQPFLDVTPLVGTVERQTAFEAGDQNEGGAGLAAAEGRRADPAVRL